MIIHSQSGVVGASAANGKKGASQLARMSSFMWLSEPAHGAHLTHQLHCALMLAVGLGSHYGAHTPTCTLTHTHTDIIQWHLSSVHNPRSSYSASDPFVLLLTVGAPVPVFIPSVCAYACVKMKIQPHCNHESSYWWHMFIGVISSH